MHVIIEINGRDALPVRAIPLLTDWRGLSPDGLAQILAGDSDHWPAFDGLTAYRLHSDDNTEPIPPRWWASWVVGKLKATSDATKGKRTSHETGYQQWRYESLAQLPAGVFVWRDEFETAHAMEYGPEGARARSNPEGFDPSVHILNPNPHPDPYIAPSRLVLAGFERLIPAPLGPVESNSTPVAPSAPVVAESANDDEASRKAIVYQPSEIESRPNYIARRLEEIQSDEYKKLKLVADAVFERLEKAQSKLALRQAVVDAGPPFFAPTDVVEADVEKAKREVAEAERNIRVMRGDFPDTMKEPESEAEQQFWFQNVSLELEHWAALADVSAREAAMLLCQRNPRKTSFEEAKTIIFPDLPDGHLERLDRRLSDYAAQNPRSCRSLWDWYSAAQEMKIKLAPETVSSMEHVARRMESDSTPVTNAKSKPRTWWDVSSAYIVEVMQAGQYATAKELYRALDAKAGTDGPFDKGTGASRGSLFVREIAQPLSLKTVQNHWPALRELAKK